MIENTLGFVADEESAEMGVGLVDIVPVPDSYNIQHLRYKSRFNSPQAESHPKKSYFYEEGGKQEKRIVKPLPSHSAHAEVVGSTLFRVLGLRSPMTFFGEDESGALVVMEDISDEYQPDSHYGVLDDEILKKEFKDSLLAAILIGDYDRVPWNTMVAKENNGEQQGVAFIDFGACCGSRAQGGFNGFFPRIDVEEIRHVIASPYDLNRVDNPCFTEILDISNGELVVKDRELLQILSEKIRSLSDEVIDKVVLLSGWPADVDEAGHQKNVQFLEQTVGKLKYKLKEITSQTSLDYIKTSRALETYRMIIDEFDYDISAYFSFALKKRRDDLVAMFAKDSELVDPPLIDDSPSEDATSSPESLLGSDLNMSQIIEMMSQDDEYIKTQFESSAHVSEGFTIGEHTMMVAGQYEKYFKDSHSTSLFSSREMMIGLALHDIGKHQAFEADQSTHHQHDHTAQLAYPILEKIGFSQERAALLLDIIAQDSIGKYLQYKNLETSKNEIVSVAKKHNVLVQEVFELMYVYYMADASSYTKDATGKTGFLDQIGLFSFENETLYLSEKNQALLQKLWDSVQENMEN